MKSKNNLFIVFFLLYSTFSTSAQSLKFGVQAGGGLASAYNYFPEKNEYTTDIELGIPKNFIVPSYNFNLYISCPINDLAAVAVEPGFIQKGYSNKFIDNNDLAYNKNYLSYIQMPILLEYKIQQPITLSIGPEIGYLLRARLKNEGIDGSVNLMNYYQKNRVDVGMQFGVFYTFNERFDLGLKLGASLTNLEKNYLVNESGEVLADIKKKATYLNTFTRYKF